MKIIYLSVPRYKNLTGLSLLELILVIFILSIVMTIASPSLSYTLNKNQSDSAIRTVYRLYNTARSEAITRNRPIYFCGSNSGVSCDKQWKKFGIIFIDNDQNKKPSQDEIIHIKKLSFTRGFIESRIALGVNYIVIENRGIARYLGSLIYCNNDKQATFHRRLTWNKTGRAYLGLDKNNDNIIEKANGRNIDC